MTTSPSIAVIISVYKNTKDLAVVLRSLEQQSISDFETVISEDGDSKEMNAFLASYSGSLGIKHITQTDDGWQKNKALNNAIRNTTSDYLIFIDGDCVLHPNFVENHIKFAKKDVILAGRRVKLGEKFSSQLRETSDVISFAKSYVKNIPAMSADKGSSFVDEGVYSPTIAKLRKSSTLKGCNMSFYRTAIEKINGFDENYIRPAVGEDTDLDWRFLGMGFQIKSLRHLAIQYHLFHKENWTDASENVAYMNEKIANKEFIAKNGLSNSSA